MQLTCPNCGEIVPAEQINIQQMAAVCPSCDSVFSFDAPNTATEKAKRRKVKQPENLELHDGAALEMAFRTNWRLDQDESFIGSAALGGVFSALAFIMLFGVFQGEIPFFIPLLFAIVAAAADYAVALRVYNKTHIVMDQENIRISRKPLPGLGTEQQINLSGVVAIHVEETVASKKEAYDTPRFRIWAETVNGVNRTIITDLVEEYAYFVAQRLQERLEMLNEVDISRLDAEMQHEDEVPFDALLSASDEREQREIK
jgi:hypothetical protein